MHIVCVDRLQCVRAASYITLTSSHRIRVVTSFVRAAKGLIRSKLTVSRAVQHLVCYEIFPSRFQCAAAYAVLCLFRQHEVCSVLLLSNEEQSPLL